MGTPTRRVLSERDLNINMQPSYTNSGSFTKASRLGDISLQIDFRGEMSGAVCQGDHLGSSKRDAKIHGSEPLSKRQKTVSITRNAPEVGLEDSRRLGGGIDSDRVLTSSPPRQPPAIDAQSSSPSSASPASSLGSRQDGLDDSQNTTITELDDVPLPIANPIPTLSHPVSTPLTKEEICEKAEILKLRLKLASYKVRTNQIDIPISQLQIKTSTFTSPKLPYLPRTAVSIFQRRSPLPSTASNIPNIQIQKPSAEKRRARARIPSSPPPYLPIPKRQNKPASQSKETEGESHEGEDEGFTTPLLPRQRQDLLNPPSLGSPKWNDLTSSVVKGRAADGLLSLMGQQS